MDIVKCPLSNTNSHRRTMVVVNGKARIAQRFATDWTRIGADGLAFRGDPSKNANWSAYGAEVLAVATATVVDVKDGIPQNDPTADKKAVPITLETVGGNYIILDLGKWLLCLLCAPATEKHSSQGWRQSKAWSGPGSAR